MNKSAFVLGALTLVAVAGIAIYRADSGRNEVDYEAEFRSFCGEFKKSYLSFEEKAYRFEVFKSNFDMIREHNAKKDETYELGLNEFADLTFEEFKAYYLTDFSKQRSASGEHCEEPPKQRFRSVPDQLDWQTQGKVQKVKNQGNCGSCWAFSAIGALEGAYAIKTGQAPPELSEQELVDCSKKYGNEGCNGGYMHWAFNYIIDNNIHEGKEYPYKGRGGACQTDKIGKGKFGIAKCIRSEPSVQGLVNSIAEAPVAVALYVSATFMFYRRGIYNPSSCKGEPNHGVLAVGYDLKSSPPSYRVKNSWGVIWGESGFFHIAQGTGKGTCSIAGNGYNYLAVAA